MVLLSLPVGGTDFLEPYRSKKSWHCGSAGLKNQLRLVLVSCINEIKISIFI